MLLATRPGVLAASRRGLGAVATSMVQVPVDGGGFVTGLSIGQETYCRTDVGGAYRWDATAARWVQLLTGPGVPKAVRTGYEVEALAQAPSNGSVVYATVGSGTYGRVLRSSDKGETWQGSAQTFDIQGNHQWRYSTERLAVHPTVPTTVLLATRVNGLQQSTDGAGTFAPFPTQPPAPASAGGNVGYSNVAYDPTDPSRIYLTVEGVGLCLWNGISWSVVHAFANGFAPSLVVTPTGTAWVSYTATSDPYVTPVIRRTKAGVVTNVTPNQFRRFWGLAVDPTNEARVILVHSDLPTSGSNMYRTTNATAATPTWTDLTPSFDDGVAGQHWINDFQVQYVGQAKFSADGTALWVSTGWGVFRGTDLADAQPTLVFTSRGIEERVAQAAIKPSGHPLHTITWDNGIMRHPDGALATRPHPYKGFGSGWAIAQCPTDSSFLVAVLDPHPGNSADPAAKQSGYSTDGGATWTRFASLVAGTHPAELQFGNIAVSAGNVDNIVWAGGNFPANRMHYTTNRGSSWQVATVPAEHIIAAEHYQRRHILQAHPTASGTFYAMAYRESDGKDVLLRSTNGGAAWSAVTTTDLENYNFRYGSKLKASATHLFAIPGHTDEGNRAFYRASLTDVTAWTKITSLLNAHDIGIGAPLAGRTNPTLYAWGRTSLTGEDGYHFSTDLGTSWQLLTGYVLGLYDFVTFILGDPDTPGRSYVGFIGNGWARVQLGAVPMVPAPGIPTIGVANASSGAAAVSFTPGSPAGTSYTATSTPGGLTGESTTSPILVGSLTNGVAYTFKVKATNGGGTSAESAASNIVTPTAPAGGNATTYNFEDGTTQGWDGVNSSGFTASTTAPITGTRSLRGTATAAGNVFFRRIGVPVPAGATSAAVSLKYRQSAARDITVYADAVPGYAYLDGGFTTAPAADTVQTHTTTLALPAGTTTLDLVLRQNAAQAGDALELDDVVLTWTIA